MASKERIYLWTGKNQQGHTVNGEFVTSSVPMLRAHLRKQDISLISAAKKSFYAEWFKQKIPSVEITQFIRQLATLLKAGLPIVKALDLCSKDQKNGSLQSMLLSIRMNVESGQALSEAFAAHPKYFDSLLRSLVKAGEQAGGLEKMLERIAQYREKSLALRKKVKRALMYPTVIVVIALIVILVFLLFIVPAFDDLFRGMGSELPFLTQMMVEASAVIQQYWFYLIGSVVGFFVICRWLKRHYPPFANMLDILSLKVPLFGNLQQKFIIARFSRTLSTSYSAGLPLVESLLSVAQTAGNYVYQKALFKLQEEVAAGQFIHVAMREAKIFPSLAVQMMAVGEESAKLDETIGRLADIYEEEVDDVVDNLTQMIEPVILLVLGVVVCVLVLAMYMPIFKLGDAIR